MTVLTLILLSSSGVEANSFPIEKIKDETARLSWSIIADEILPGKTFVILFEKNIYTSRLNRHFESTKKSNTYTSINTKSNICDIPL